MLTVTRAIVWVCALKAVKTLGVEECVKRFGFAPGGIHADHVSHAALGWLHEHALEEDKRRSACAAYQPKTSQPSP